MAMSESQIERIAEREMDKLDEQLMNGKISQGNYEHEADKIDLWVKEQYAELRKHTSVRVA